MASTTDSGFLSESYPAIKFPEIGSAYKGQLISITKLSDTDPASGAVKTWPNGEPKHVFVWRVVDKEGEVANIWARGNLVKVLRDACKAAGVKSEADLVGATVQIKHHALGEKKSAAFNAPKLFQAKITLLDDDAKREAFKAAFTEASEAPVANSAATDDEDYDPFGDE